MFAFYACVFFFYYSYGKDDDLNSGCSYTAVYNMQEFIQIHWCIFILLRQGRVLCRTLGLPEEEQQQEGEEAPPAPQQGIFYVHTDSIKYEQYIRVWCKFVIVIIKNIKQMA